MTASPKPRAAIYARFSSDLQDERSIADQLALCGDYAARAGWEVVATFCDHAVSGASIHGRAEYQRMLDDAQARRFEIILAEDVDRYGRNSADTMRFKELADFIGVRLFTVADGEANELLFGFKGLMGALWLKTHALKVRRGLDGRVRAGLSGGGQCYGYASVPGEPGRKTIVEAEAHIIRRIFAEYLEGRSAREIAHRLNAEGIRAPRGPRWNASTINGSRSRQNGILGNPLYAGELVWNRVRMVKDPATGKRISRLNPAEQQRRVTVPELAIVAPETFAAVAARKLARAPDRPEAQRRRRYILSGLLRCGACGSGMTVRGKDKSGRTRVACSRHVESRTCEAPQSFYLDAIESLVIDCLRAELRDPTVLTEYVRTYIAERRRLAKERRNNRSRLARRLAQVEREIRRAVDAIVQGASNAKVMGERTHELAAEQEKLQHELAQAEAPEPSEVALHPAALDRYERTLATLQQSLNSELAVGDRAGAEALAELIEKVMVSRDETGRLEVRIFGRLHTMLGATSFPLGSPSGGTLVAGERSSRSPHWPFQLLARAS